MDDAGSGIIHQEMPSGDPDGKMYGFQLWANLPGKSKMIDPNYQGVVDAEIPRVNLDNGGEVRVICGYYNGRRGPIKNVTFNPNTWMFHFRRTVVLPVNSQQRIRSSPMYSQALAYFARTQIHSPL